MNKKIFYFTLIFIIMLLLPIQILNATNTTNKVLLYDYEFNTPEVILDTEKQDNQENLRNTPPATYDFVDEDNYYNLIYTSEKNVYWDKFDDGMNKVRETIVIPMFYNNDNIPSDDFYYNFKEVIPNFGNAIYDNGFLYVVYGKYASSKEKDKYEDNVLAIVKYDKQGNEIKHSEIKAIDLSYTTSNYEENATTVPFWGESDCDLVINNGVLAGLIGRTRFDGHQDGFLFFIDTESLNYLSNYNSKNYDITYIDIINQRSKVSHSIAQRLIKTGNDFLMIEASDAFPGRGYILQKFVRRYDEENSKYKFDKTAFLPFHFRELPNYELGKNNTYTTIGNILELSDGYMFISASEKTLSLEYSNSYNESYNIFAQKYKKDMENYEDRKDIMMFDTPVRTTVGTKPVEETGKLYLTGTDSDYDYGIKWLTNNNDENDEYIITTVNSIKIEDEKIAIVWQEDPISKNNTFNYKYHDTTKSNSYYQIIDKDANILEGPYKLENVKLNRQSNYVYKDGYIYWSTADGINSKITIHKLPIHKEDQKVLVTSIDLDKTQIKLDINNNPTDTLTATVNPSNATNKDLEWAVDNSSSVISLNTYTGNTVKITAKGTGTATITAKAKDGSNVSKTCVVTVTKENTPVVPPTVKPSVSYITHIQNHGWRNYVKNGESSGTVGEGLRLEGIKIKLENCSSGGIEYRTHIQNIGWEETYKSNDEFSGTEGQGLRLEAIQIKLTGEVSQKYDVYYRVHAENVGWLDWAKNGQEAGTAKYGFRLEAIQIKLVEKNEPAPGKTDTPFMEKPEEKPNVLYITHIQNHGWRNYVKDGESSGTVGEGLRLEGIKIKLENCSSGGIEYRTHIENIGWEETYKSNDEFSGTEGQGLRLEAIQIKLTGEVAQKYDVYYRVHAENVGWLDWAKNGQEAGTAKYGFRLEAIQIKLVDKNGPAPGKTDRPFMENK